MERIWRRDYSRVERGRWDFFYFWLTKKPPFLLYQDEDIWLLRQVYQAYQGSNDKTHLFTRVLTARAGNLALDIFQNYHENIFSELDFRKDRTLELNLDIH